MEFRDTLVGSYAMVVWVYAFPRCGDHSLQLTQASVCMGWESCVVYGFQEMISSRGGLIHDVHYARDTRKEGGAQRTPSNSESGEPPTANEDPSMKTDSKEIR